MYFILIYFLHPCFIPWQMKDVWVLYLYAPWILLGITFDSELLAFIVLVWG